MPQPRPMLPASAADPQPDPLMALVGALQVFSSGERGTMAFALRALHGVRPQVMARAALAAAARRAGRNRQTPYRSISQKTWRPAARSMLRRARFVALVKLDSVRVGTSARLALVEATTRARLNLNNPAQRSSARDNGIRNQILIAAIRS